MSQAAYINKDQLKTIKSKQAMIRKSDISERFGASAQTYDRGAALQRAVGNHLLTLMPEQDKELACLLDLGSGPGYFTSALNDRCQQLIGLDIAPKMLQFARQRNDALQVTWLSGDAEQLPLGSNTLSGIYSSLMLQWVHDLTRALIEAHRVLKPGAHMSFSTLLDGTLFELNEAWAHVDDKQHVNAFLSEVMLRQAISDSGLTLMSLTTKTQPVYYETVVGLMRDLKNIGASQTSQRGQGLMGRQALKKLAAGYEKYRSAKGLSASYQVAYCVLQKPATEIIDE
ncbi:MAG: malonyl-ACP O-methyltransferase BioC [Psychrobium sp.]|nr:malonyl-ACP O-methyltransferase BioC [Psychrobium sp.]